MRRSSETSIGQDGERKDGATVIRADVNTGSTRPDVAAPPVPQMPSTRRARMVSPTEIAETEELVTQARSVLETACTQVDDMIGSARAIITRAEAEAATIIEEARAAAERISSDARTRAASLDRSALPLQPPHDSADPPAPQKKSFAAMWARAGDQVESVDDVIVDKFFVGADATTANDLAKRLSPRWRQG